MRFSLLFLAALSGLLIFATVGCGGPPRSIDLIGDDFVVGTVNDTPIYWGSVRASMAEYERPANPSSELDTSDRLRITLIQAVRVAATYAEALERGYEPDEEGLDSSIEIHRALCEANMEECLADAEAHDLTIQEALERRRFLYSRRIAAEWLRAEIIEAAGMGNADAASQLAYRDGYLDGLVEQAEIDWRDRDAEMLFETGWAEREELLDRPEEPQEETPD
ncbi:MAG: hypothetical protein WD533_00605 [Dehalococcoidia bacterium]